ncbi:MAG: GrpB family protein [Rhizobiaceae bacterium]
MAEPIILEDHNLNWHVQFELEAGRIQIVLGEIAVTVHHIGSTAIPSILAKPIIDILVEVRSLDELDAASAKMSELGYEVMGAFGIEGRRYFRKLDSTGTRTHHVHAFMHGSDHVIRHLAFRDFLIAYPSTAREYSDLKARLVSSPLISRDTYMDGKSPFIKATQRKAVAWYRNRNSI